MISLESLSPDTIQMAVDIVPFIAGALVGSEGIAHSSLKSNGWLQLGMNIIRVIINAIGRGDGKR